MQYPGPIAKLIDSYMKLPGIGEKPRLALLFIHWEWTKKTLRILPSRS